jgi:hypothetical protein
MIQLTLPQQKNIVVNCSGVYQSFYIEAECRRSGFTGTMAHLLLGPVNGPFTTRRRRFPHGALFLMRRRSSQGDQHLAVFAEGKTLARNMQGAFLKIAAMPGNKAHKERRRLAEAVKSTMTGAMTASPSPKIRRPLTRPCIM